MYRITFHIKIVLLLLLCASFLRLYSLTWGAPYYFHPDERNIIGAVTKLSFPNQMNPDFFAYGSLPIYSIYFVSLLFTQILSETDIFSLAVVTSRVFSSAFSICLIPLLYLVGKKLRHPDVGILAAFFATWSIGLIQYAHFGTFEMWQAFFITLLLFVTFHALEKRTVLYVFLQSFLVGILISIKISNSIFFFPVLLSLFFILRKKREIFQFKALLLFLLLSFLSLTIIALIVLVTSPYFYLDYKAFKNSIEYETSVGLGSLLVFYTQSFLQTTPVVFQYSKIFPFIMNPFLTIVLAPSIFFALYWIIKKRDMYLFFVLIFWSIYFFSQAFLFAKWSRYMILLLPFSYLIIAYALYELLIYFKKTFGIIIKTCIIILLIIPSIVYGTFFVITTYAEPDTRIAASLWAKDHMRHDTLILSEVYDLGIVPFNASFPHIQLFNFYELDTNSAEANKQKLANLLQDAEYIVLPSQRILTSRFSQPSQFPLSSTFYANLFSGKLGFTKIYQSPCSFFCSLVYSGDPIMQYEETATVFDRPTVFIFKKNHLQ